MNFWATGESVALVVSVISVISLCTEITVKTAVCQALFLAGWCEISEGKG
jgi:hypothetical protein